MIFPESEKTPRWRSGLLAGLLLLAACGEDPGRVQPGIGAQLPAVVLTGLTDEAPTSTGALRGTALIINFWATWCVPCRSEMPSLERLSHRLAAHGVRVIGVAVDHDLNLAREFVRAYQLTFPIYADGDKKAFQSALHVSVLPETVLVTAEGAVAARIAGVRDWDGAEGDRLLELAFNLRLHADGMVKPGANRVSRKGRPESGVLDVDQRTLQGAGHNVFSRARRRPPDQMLGRAD